MADLTGLFRVSDLTASVSHMLSADESRVIRSRVEMVWTAPGDNLNDGQGKYYYFFRKKKL